MNTLVNIVITALLVIWGGVLMMSPMMIAARGMRDSRSSVLMVMVILGYPIIVFLIVKFLGFRYFGTNTTGWLIAVTVVWGLVISLYGLPRLLLNIGKGIPNNGYFITPEVVYLDGKQVKGADPKSFRSLDDDRYAVDATSVYYYGKQIPDAHAHSFRPLTGQADSIVSGTFATYWVDDSRVYYNGTPIPNSDAETFQLLTNAYAKDKNRVYFTDRVLAGAKPETFRLLNEVIGTDGEAVYVSVKRSNTRVDMNTFEAVDGEYCRDKDNIYMVFILQDEPLVKAEGADPETFTVLERSYAKDKNHVYFFGSYEGKGQRFVTLKGANPATFTIAYDAKTRSEAHDGNRHWMYGELVKP